MVRGEAAAAAGERHETEPGDRASLIDIF